MPKLWVHDGTTWQQVKQLHVKNSANVWTPVRQGFVNDGGINKMFYPDYTGNVSYTSPGQYTYTVPAGIQRLQITVAGAGGGGGGNDSSYSGHAGYGGNVVTWTSTTIWPGNTLVISVGSPGMAGSTGTGAAGGLGGTDVRGISYGGNGGASGTSGSSGSGGGGGAASWVEMNGSNVACAAGGAGGGGAGVNSAGLGILNISVNPYTYGSVGQYKVGDGGGAGGGGGGFPRGAPGGQTVAGDNGAYSGGYGLSYVTPVPSEGGNSLGYTSSIASNGGAAATDGSAGYVTIVPII